MTNIWIERKKLVSNKRSISKLRSYTSTQEEVPVETDRLLQHLKDAGYT